MARSFSEDLKWRVVYLYHDGHRRKKIAELLHISKATVDKVLQIYVQWGTVVNPWQKLPGRHKTLTRNEMKILQELVKDKVDWYLDELVRELELQTGKLISIPTLWRSLVYCGISRKKLIFMGEAAKDERSLSRGYGYSLKNTFATKKNVFVRGIRYTILPALSLQGIIAVDIMEGNCTKEKFREFVISNVVPQMNAYPNEQSVLVKAPNGSVWSGL
ncbi:unnamed protein product [Rhizophagus irregularis]|nr:unnamed protein product [Rhizophagus irregularis]